MTTAEKTKTVWHVGCSGFHYKDWKEVFYPAKLPQRLWFEYYCQHFKTLELNVTFYRFPTVAMLKGWYNRSPQDFLFTVKAPKAITHYKKLNDCVQMVDDFYATAAEGLQEKNGCLLFQFPPSFHYNEFNMERILNNLRAGFTNVVEFRHGSWWSQEVYKTLAEKNITFCGMSHPTLPDDVVENTSTLYYRMHGVPLLYRSPYALHDLEKIVKAVDTCKKVNSAFVYFNNDISAAAIDNAKQIMEFAFKKTLD